MKITDITPKEFKKLGYEDVREFVKELHNYLNNSTFDSFDKVEKWTLLDAIKDFIAYRDEID